VIYTFRCRLCGKEKSKRIFIYLRDYVECPDCGAEMKLVGGK